MVNRDRGAALIIQILTFISIAQQETGRPNRFPRSLYHRMTMKHIVKASLFKTMGLE